MSARGLPSFHLDPNALDSTRIAKERPRIRRANWFVNSSTGVVCVRVVVPVAVLPKSSPGKFLALIVKSACGELSAVEPLKVKSGIILRI